MFRKVSFIVFAMAFLSILLMGCATTDRSGFKNDCDYAKARYEEMQKSVRTYYALGTTSVAEIAVAERRLKKAKEEYEAACGVKAPESTP